MRYVEFYAKTNRSGNILHIVTDGAVINIQVGLTDRTGRPVTSVRVSPSDESFPPDPDGYYWRQADASRIVRDPKPYMHVDNSGTLEPWCKHDAPAVDQRGYCECGERISGREYSLYDGDMHFHKHEGQTLLHEHKDGDRPHGYYGHPEDRPGNWS